MFPAFVQLIQAILLEYKHIETFLESSAKKQQSIPDIFYYAVKSVVHPAEPLVEFHTGQLKPLCVKALKRIFLLCDTNAVRGIGTLHAQHLYSRHAWCSTGMSNVCSMSAILTVDQAHIQAIWQLMAFVARQQMVMLQPSTFGVRLVQHQVCRQPMSYLTALHELHV